MTFSDLKLSDYLLRAITYASPTTIQELVIPLILDGRDVIAKARTGTGKTAAFALPIIMRLNDMPASTQVNTLVLAPTRELAVQVESFIVGYARFTPRPLRTVALVGGEDIQEQVDKLCAGVDIIVATPGRLLDILDNNHLSLADLKTLIIDEADKLLDLGFAEELQRLATVLPCGRQTVLLSATFPARIIKLAEQLLRDPAHVADQSSPTIETIEQRVIMVDRENRRQLLQHLLTTADWQQVMVFVATKRAARNLGDKLFWAQISVASFHGDLGQAERTHILNDFNRGHFRVLITTDIASRGIDVEALSCVVNYDLPRSPIDYIHRIGRTGRAGQSGTAISFIDADSSAHFALIEKRAGIRLQRESIAGFEASRVATKIRGGAPVKGKRKSKKDKLREQAAALKLEEE